MGIQRNDHVVIVQAVISIARALGMTTTAEGVETAEQLQFLRSQSCDAVQGYFLYRPLREDEVAEALRLNRRTCAGAALAIA